jgi:hypothetical protein
MPRKALKQNPLNQYISKKKKAMIETDLIPEKILPDDKLSLEVWCDILNCEKQDLLQAMSVMGNSVQAVDDYLILNRRKKC